MLNFHKTKLIELVDMDTKKLNDKLKVILEGRRNVNISKQKTR